MHFTFRDPIWPVAPVLQGVRVVCFLFLYVGVLGLGVVTCSAMVCGVEN